jgi:histidinol-phosphate phosphatase domain
MKIVIMAGGKGTRIAQVNATVPKPMIPIEGKPILEYQIETLKNQGYTDIILIVGHMGNVIQEYFGDGAEFGVQISYIIEEQPLGTAGALYFLKDEIKDDFLLLNGDIIFDVNIQKFLEYHCKQGTVATILTHPNSHPYDSGIIIADEKKRVINWLHKEDERLWYKNRVNAGLHMLSPRIFDLFTEVKKCDLDRDILKPLIKDRELSVYDSPEYIKDMGTPDRYYAVIEDIKSGKVSAKNLKNKQKAIFLDRDGTINKYVGFLTDINEFELLDGVTEAIKMINESGYLAIVVTNQPVIARGEVSVEELQEIHNKMETLLGQAGAYIDDIFYCPHHPHKGYEGERPEYKIECECRKPKPGMLFAAAEKYNIDLSESWMIGDGENDIEAGKNAGCKVCAVGDVEINNVPRYNSLLECIKAVFEQR